MSRSLSFKVKQLLKFPLQGDAKDQRELGRGVELPRLDGADGIAGDAHQPRQLGLGQIFLCPAFSIFMFMIQAAAIPHPA